jgi:hypothetical protein
MIAGDVIYVIEPHADDAFLSLGWSIQKWTAEGQRVEIVTIYSSDIVRAREVQRWAASVGAHWRGLGHDEPPTNGFELTTEKVPPLPRPLLPPEMMSASRCRIWPLGLQHPDHIVVASCAPRGDLQYVDTPYQLSLYHQPRVREALIGRTFEWWLRPPRRKWDASRFFASQRVLFDHYAPDRMEMVPEIVVR